MNQTATTKPKTKFSSRNLNAVFKASLVTKQLPENVTRPLRRPDSRMLVLGRATVAPPAPLNTPSLKRESQLHNLPVSLVPASSKWAENAVKSKASEQLPEVDDELATATSAKIWTPINVAKHLHTSVVATHPKDTVKSFSRWGDDAVDDDIIHHEIVRQRQQEIDFPDLKHSVENMSLCNGQSLVDTDTTQSMDRQEPETYRGRATGRWAHLNDEKMKQRFSQNNRWHHDHYRRYEDDRWCDDDSGRESRHFTVSSGCHAHFSRSDVRFDMMMTSDGDCAWRNNSHEMEWNSISLHHEKASLENTEGSCYSSQSRHTASPPPFIEDPAQLRSAPESPNQTDDSPQFKSTEWFENIKPSSFVAEETRSSTESSTYSSLSSSPALSHQQQSLEHSKMLFDPKTGSMISARDMSRHVKRQTGERSGKKDRYTAKTLEATRAGTRVDRKLQEYKPPTLSESSKVQNKQTKVAPGVEDSDLSASQTVGVATEQKDAVKDTALATGDPDIEMVAKDSLAGNHLTMKQLGGLNTGSRLTKRLNSSRPSTSRTPQKQQELHSARSSTVFNVRESQRFGSSKTSGCIWRKISVRHDQSDTEGNELVQNVRDISTIVAQKSDTDGADAPMKLIVEGSHGGVADETNASDGSLKTDAPETVQSRRAALPVYKKKENRERVVHVEAKVDLVRGKKKNVYASGKERADVLSKREEVQENFSGASRISKVDSQPSSKPHAKTAYNTHSNDQMPKERQSKRLSRQTTRKCGRRNKEVVAKAQVHEDTSNKASVNVKSSEEVAGDAPPLSKASTTVTPAARASVGSKKERQDDHARSSLRCRGGDKKLLFSDASPTRKQKLSKRQGSEPSIKAFTTNRARAPGGANARLKQVRQMYVVKTAAPTSTAASV